MPAGSPRTWPTTSCTAATNGSPTTSSPSETLPEAPPEAREHPSPAVSQHTFSAITPRCNGRLWRRLYVARLRGGEDANGEGCSPTALGRSGFGGHADRVESSLEARDRAVDVAELVETEQADAEG